MTSPIYRVGRASALLAAGATFGACVDGPGESTPLPEADFELFVASAQPVLELRCGTPSCHGDAMRPFEVYAPHSHRLDPADDFLDTPLTEEELLRGFDEARAFLTDVDVPEDSLLLRKALHPDAGGAVHAGGVQFLDATDSGYQGIYEWVADALQGGAGGEG